MGVEILEYKESALEKKYIVKLKCSACNKIWYEYLGKLQDLDKIMCNCRKEKLVCDNEVEQLNNIVDSVDKMSKSNKDIKRISKTFERIVKKYGKDNVSWKSASEFIEWSLMNKYRSWKKLEVAKKEKCDKLVVSEKNCKWVGSTYGLKSGACNKVEHVERVVGGSVEEASSIINKAIEICESNNCDNNVLCILNELYDKCAEVSKILDEVM